MRLIVTPRSTAFGCPSRFCQRKRSIVMGECLSAKASARVVMCGGAPPAGAHISALVGRVRHGPLWPASGAVALAKRPLLPPPGNRFAPQHPTRRTPSATGLVEGSERARLEAFVSRWLWGCSAEAFLASSGLGLPQKARDRPIRLVADLAVDAEEGKQYAAKLERGESFAVGLPGAQVVSHPVSCAADSPAAQLPYEARVYRVLEVGSFGARAVDTHASPERLLQGMRGAPKLHWCGRESGYNVLVVDLLGPSLEDMFNFCGRKFTVKTVCEVGLQMLELIEQVHERGVMHRDIKPDNFLLGLGSAADQLHIIDFGLAKGWRDSRGKHIPFRDGKSLTGTARYCSIPTHKGHEQGRRDDCESVAYVLLYFLKGRLPWQGIKVTSKRRKYAEILRRKESNTPDELCTGLPDEFRQLLVYTRELGFEDKPDYAWMRGRLEAVMERGKWERDGLCDWVVKNMGDSGRIGEAMDAQLLAAHIRRARRRRMAEAEAAKKKEEEEAGPATGGAGKDKGEATSSGISNMPASIATSAAVAADSAAPASPVTAMLGSRVASTPGGSMLGPSRGGAASPTMAEGGDAEGDDFLGAKDGGSVGGSRGADSDD
jgi:serine/threonine protein kinase